MKNDYGTIGIGGGVSLGSFRRVSSTRVVRRLDFSLFRIFSAGPLRDALTIAEGRTRGLSALSWRIGDAARSSFVSEDRLVSFNNDLAESIHFASPKQTPRLTASMTRTIAAIVGSRELDFGSNHALSSGLSIEYRSKGSPDAAGSSLTIVGITVESNSATTLCSVGFTYRARLRHACPIAVAR